MVKKMLVVACAIAAALGAMAGPADARAAARPRTPTDTRAACARRLLRASRPASR